MLQSNLLETKRKRGRPSLSKSLDPVKVLEISLELFAEKGFEGTQQKDIADRLGVSNPLLSYHFKNKQQIWEKAIAHAGTQLVERFDQVKSILKDLSGFPLLKAYTRQLFYFCAENPNFVKILLQELNKASWRSEFINENIMSVLLRLGVESMEGAKAENNAFVQIHASHFIPLLIGAASSPIIMNNYIQSTYDKESTDMSYVEKHADIFNALIYDQFDNSKNNYGTS